MAQIIQNKRGTLERLPNITGSLKKGEILIVTGSSNITSSNGSSILFISNENGHVEASNRIMRTTGSSAPIFSSSIYDGLVDGVPFYASGSSTLYLLGGNTNEAINLEGNIQPFSTSVNSRINTLATTSSNNFIGNQNITGDLIVTGTLTAQEYHTELISSSIIYQSGSTKFGDTSDDTHELTGSLKITGSLYLNGSDFSASVANSLNSLSASAGYIQYVTNSVQNLTGIEVADYDNNTAVTFTNGVLKFIFGTPTSQLSVAASLSGFSTDRFNKVTDAYTINGSWSNGGYTLISASLYEGSTLLTQVGSGTSLSYSTTTSGSHTYRLEYTASSPLDNSLYETSTTTTGTVSKSNPASPTLTATPDVQLGYSSNQIEQGATGSITFTSSSANPSNSWNLTSVTTNVATPYYITGSATGSTSISITATANYTSPTGDNSPDLTTTSTTTRTYTKIRSLRYGASPSSSFTSAELENLALWDTTLGGTIGTIVKGTTTASGQSVTITWTGDKYHYIVFNSSLSNLTNITTSGFGVLSSFTSGSVGQYKVYKTADLQAGGAGSSITYTLT